jgi:transcription initiation factor TFIIB
VRKMKMQEETKKCPKCGNANIISDPENGERVCSSCGLVIEETSIDMGPEWRAFTSDEKNSRSRTGLGATLTLYDKGLSTVFNGDRDAAGKKLNNQARLKMDRLRRYDNRSKFDETWRRNLSVAMAELDRISVILHIPNNVKEQAALIYRKALKADLIRGRSIDAFVAASIYAACRASQVPRQIKKVSEASTRDHAEVARTYRLIIKELKLRMPVDEPMKFVSSIAAKLRLRRDTEQTAINILQSAKIRRGLTGKDPRGLAAAALYMACIKNDDKRIQKDVAIAAGTTEVTLRNRLRGLVESTTPIQSAQHVIEMPLEAPVTA